MVLFIKIRYIEERGASADDRGDRSERTLSMWEQEEI
jgi:hypothetical protein